MLNQAQALCGLYYKHITTLNNDSSVVNKFETSLTDDARVIIYDCYMFIVKALSHVYRVHSETPAFSF
jgi:hypothetical protein